MKGGTAISLAVLALVLVPAPAGAGTSSGTAVPELALTATPARLAFAGSGTATVRVANTGPRSIRVHVGRAGFALDLRGRPRVVQQTGPRAAVSWLRIGPARFVIPAGASRQVQVSARLPAGAEPGDHDALLLLTTRPESPARVAVRMRIGVVVVVRAPGRVVRRIVLAALRSRSAGAARRVELRLANRGNVTERLARGSVRVRLTRGRAVALLSVEPRELRRRSTGVVEIAYRGPLRGWVTARVVVARDRDRPLVSRTFRVKL